MHNQTNSLCASLPAHPALCRDLLLYTDEAMMHGRVGPDVMHRKKKYIYKTSSLGKLPSESNNIFTAIQSLTLKENLQALPRSRASVGAKEGYSALALPGAMCRLSLYFVAVL